MTRFLLLASLSACLLCGPATVRADDPAREMKLRLRDSATEFKLVCKSVAGSDACVYLGNEGSTFYLRFTYKQWSKRVDLGQGQVKFDLGPAHLTVTVSNLSVTGDKIKFHLKVEADITVIVTIHVKIFDDDVTVNKPHFAADFRPGREKADEPAVIISSDTEKRARPR